ncbi:MAG: class I SAM-dependent methyltransferase [Candidatus Brocadiaceae bacterium]|nr:class I SAM-dependent methyltransferase [Candidatus Brocadiaceae bacterium]
MFNVKKSVLYSLLFLYIMCFCPVPGKNASFVSAREQDKTFWDRKYATEDYIFGKEPADFLRDHIDILPKGRALDIAAGEGRNAVFLAENGFDVDAYDISEVALKKAEELADEKNVKIHTVVADLESCQLPKNTYNVITCFYYLQHNLIQQIKEALRPGGIIIYETYTVDNLERGLPGPRNKNYLLKTNELLNFFRDFTIMYYRELVVDNKKAIASLIAKK